MLGSSEVKKGCICFLCVWIKLPAVKVNSLFYSAEQWGFCQVVLWLHIEFGHLGVRQKYWGIWRVKPSGYLPVTLKGALLHWIKCHLCEGVARASLPDACHAGCTECAPVMQTALRAPSGAESPLSPCAESHNLLTCILSTCLDKSAASFALTQFRQRCTAVRCQMINLNKSSWRKS